MPTMDLDASLRALCRQDPRFRAEAYRFLLEALDFTLHRRAAPGAAPAPALPGQRPSPAGPVPSNVAGRDLLEGFRDLALDRFGALAHEVLRTWGITRTDDVGAVVFNMVEAGLLQKTASDSPADYHAVFDFEASLERAFSDGLRTGSVRLADGPPAERPAPGKAVFEPGAGADGKA